MPRQPPIDQLGETRQKPVFMGLDTGVKGALFVWEHDQPDFKTWDFGAMEKDNPEKVERAIRRGMLMAKTVLAGYSASRLVVGADKPMFQGPGGPVFLKDGSVSRDKVTGKPKVAKGKNPYGWGVQCALYAALYATLESAGAKVRVVDSRSCRAFLGVRGRGKEAIIAWAEPKIGPYLKEVKSKWARETICEAFMLMEATKRIIG